MKFFVRKATIADVENIAAIGQKTFYETFYQAFNNKKELADYIDTIYQPAHIQENLLKSSNIYLVLFADGNAAGFAKIKTNCSTHLIDNGSQFELQRIYVSNEYHGSGAAQALMSAVIEECAVKEADHLWLEVYIHNTKAKRFYEKNGFTIAGNHSFKIGSQTFQFHIMDLEVLVTTHK